MSADDDGMFRAQRDWHHNACLQGYMGFAQLGHYYLESANALIMRSVEDSGKLDVFIYSVVFLCRHSFELTLKELVWMSGFLLHRTKQFPKTHRLLHLWDLAKRNSVALLSNDFPLGKEEVRITEACLAELQTHDPESDSFRYPYDKGMVRTHPGVTHINVRSLYEKCNEADDHIRTVLTMVRWLCDQEQQQP